MVGLIVGERGWGVDRGMGSEFSLVALMLITPWEPKLEKFIVP